MGDRVQSGDFGQPRLEVVLEEMLERGRLAGSFLFEGPVGVGKEALAVELGRLLNCEREPRCQAKPPFGSQGGGAPDAARAEKPAPAARSGAGRSAASKASAAKPAAHGAGVPGRAASGLPRCNSCHKFDLLQHPDLLLVFPLPKDTWDEKLPEGSRGGEPARNTIGRILHEKAHNPYFREDFDEHVNIEADLLRERVIPTVYSRPVEGRFKTVIISDCEYMAPGIANLLLKTLEEPPANCLFVLATSVPQRLLATIRSRCQRMRFAPLAPEWMQPRLQAFFEESPVKVRVAAALSQGSMHLAGRYLRGDLDELRDGAFAALQGAASGEALDLLDLAATLAQQRREKRYVVPLFLGLLAAAARDVLMMREGMEPAAAALVNADRVAALEKLARGLDAGRLREIIRAAERAEREIAGQALAEHALGRLFLGMTAAGADPGAPGGGRSPSPPARGPGSPARGTGAPARGPGSLAHGTGAPARGTSPPARSSSSPTRTRREGRR
jgi:DNA polymerase-3 subunit delta'